MVLIRAVDRSVAYTDTTDLDIAEWLEANPRIREVRTAHPGSIEECLMVRIARHRGRSVDVSAPSPQQTAFETPSQSLGLGGLLVGTVLLRLLIRRIFDSSIPCPNHRGEGSFAERSTPGALQIAALIHHFIAGRINGRTLTGGNFALRFGFTFGARLEHKEVLSGDEEIVRLGERLRLSDNEIIKDLRKFTKPLDILSNFLGQTKVAMRGLGFHLKCEYKEAILIATDLFLMASMIGRPLPGLAKLMKGGTPNLSFLCGNGWRPTTTGRA